MRKDALVIFVLLFLAGFLFFGTLYFARELLIPLCFAALLAMLMLPLCRKLESWRLPKWLSILISLLVVVSVVAGLVFLVANQVMNFANDLPRYKEAVNSKIERLQDLFEDKTHVSPQNQTSFLKEKATAFLENGGQYVKMLFVATTTTLVTIGLVLIYSFFFLFFRNRFRSFMLMIVPDEQKSKAQDIINESSKVTVKYLSGVLIVIVILAVLNSVGLMIIGLDYAIFFGSLVAVLNIIPYVGVLLGSILPITMALVTKDSFWAAAGVAGVFMLNQFIENNFLTPKIVGTQVNLNPLATIIVLLIGGSVWGVAGMIIFLPFLGVLKIIMDHVTPLKPYAYLIGIDREDKPSKIGKWFSGLMRSIKK